MVLLSLYLLNDMNGDSLEFVDPFTWLTNNCIAVNVIERLLRLRNKEFVIKRS